MHYGYRIVEDMIEGLSEYLDAHGMKSVQRAAWAARSRRTRSGATSTSRTSSIAKIDPKTCIGCQLCVTACNDGAHQCIFTGREDKRAPAARARARQGHARRSRSSSAPSPATACPWVDEPECVGCNLCQLVCPVPGCITMEESRDGPPETWNDRVAAGRDKVPGGIHE